MLGGLVLFRHLPSRHSLPPDAGDDVLITPLPLKLFPCCLQGTGLAFSPLNGVGGLADCLK